MNSKVLSHHSIVSLSIASLIYLESCLCVMVSISEFVLNLVATTMPLSYVSLIPPERQLKTFVYREAHILMAVATKFCPNLW